MKFDPHIHRRRSIRLKEYDYSMPGEYFVTICTNEKECLFGEVVEEDMKLSQFGEIKKHVGWKYRNIFKMWNWMNIRICYALRA
jgi:hypothetical protein